MVIMDQVQAGIFPGLSLLQFLNFDIDTFENLRIHHYNTNIILWTSFPVRMLILAAAKILNRLLKFDSLT